MKLFIFPQEQITAAIALAMEQQIQKLLSETQLDMTEFDNLLQPIIDTCTKDAISVWCLLLPFWNMHLYCRNNINIYVSYEMKITTWLNTAFLGIQVDGLYPSERFKVASIISCNDAKANRL